MKLIFSTIIKKILTNLYLLIVWMFKYIKLLEYTDNHIVTIEKITIYTNLNILFYVGEDNMVKQKFTMNLDKEIRKQLSHIAIDEEKTVTEIVTELIIKYIEEYEKQE